MDREDDDLTRHQGGEEFQFDDSDDEFRVPDTPYGEEDDDILSGATEFIGDSSEIDDGVIAGDGDFSVGDEPFEQEFEAEAEEPEYQEYPEQVDDERYEDEGTEPFKLGWKSYLGIALAVVLTAGGMGTFLFSEPGAQQQSRPAAMDPAKLQQLSAQNGNNGGQSQVSPPSNAGQSQTGSSQSASMPPGNAQKPGQGPVEVEAFPGMNQNNGGGQVAAAPANNSANDSPIPDPARQKSPDDGPYADIENQRRFEMDRDQIERIGSDFFVRKDEFSGIRASVRDNGNQLDRLAKRYTSTQKEVADLQSRVATLESRKRPGLNSSSDKAKPEPDPKVKDAQIILTAYDYAPGPIDGLMGDRTRDAIKRFQKVAGLNVTGTLNKETLDALDDPKRNPTPARHVVKQRAVSVANSASQSRSTWFIRGVTSTRAIVYKRDGTSYPVEIGTEIPGMGQVEALYPDKREVKTSKGVIKEL